MLSHDQLIDDGAEPSKRIIEQQKKFITGKGGCIHHSSQEIQVRNAALKRCCQRLKEIQIHLKKGRQVWVSEPKG